MSRSQKNVRLRTGSAAAKAAGGVREPESVTQKDGANNVAGTVDPNRVTADDYTTMRRVGDPFN